MRAAVLLAGLTCVTAGAWADAGVKLPEEPAFSKDENAPRDAAVTERMHSHKEMMAWWCAKPGKGDSLPCMHMRLREAPTEEREALLEQVKALTKERKSADKGSPMHEVLAAWCEGDDAPGKDSHACQRYGKTKDRLFERDPERLDRLEHLEGHPSRHAAKLARDGRRPPVDKNDPEHLKRVADGQWRRSEMDNMTKAYCGKPGNEANVPCIHAKIRDRDVPSEERKQLLEQVKSAGPQAREQRDEMMKEYCGDDEEKLPDPRSICAKCRAESSPARAARSHPLLHGTAQPCATRLQVLHGEEEDRAPLSSEPPPARVQAPHAHTQREARAGGRPHRPPTEQRAHGKLVRAPKATYCSRGARPLALGLAPRARRSGICVVPRICDSHARKIRKFGTKKQGSKFTTFQRCTPAQTCAKRLRGTPPLGRR
jgi:hypothetical protein